MTTLDPYPCLIRRKPVLLSTAQSPRVSIIHYSNVFPPPNATSSYTFAGYNLSQPYPGTFLADSSFTLDVSIWGNVEYSNTSRVRTWQQFSIGADDGLVQSESFEVHESWRFCNKWFLKPMGGNEEIAEDCEGFVSDGCLEALRSLASDQNYCDNSVGRPDECDGDDFAGVSYGWR
ncbi:hypothetical protein B0I35DRAFT_411587 [Stachybotrys elegans]|uniref:Uncharacterized protein n=1 Tax=Stachybotrys elegans TaxID=80388 RepID=A0A8K0WNG7_9HYPO|nr:hypothetical protein B0I35DRAFT_411587 [Stachybotrys elegans]